MRRAVCPAQQIMLPPTVTGGATVVVVKRTGNKIYEHHFFEIRRLLHLQ